MLHFNIKETFTNQLPADPIAENSRRLVEKACYSVVVPKKTKKPSLIHVSDAMLSAIGLQPEDKQIPDFLQIMTGNQLIPNTTPFAMCYGGHQFGQWAGQLGDGRAINLTEVNHNKTHWAIQLKGAGETPYSRTADGLAVLRSSIREYLCSEAMHHLGIPTTRALSLALTGDDVLRDVMYNGNPAYEKGAIVSRVAPSFLRFGNFEIFASREDSETLKTLVDYTITNFYPELGEPSKETYLAFFKEVSNRTLEMIIHWQRVGFVHGVMNTDNMSILGLTIDYGPYGWLEEYDLGWTPNTTDNQHKRYRYGNQPNIGLWNLLQLANTLYPLIEEATGLEEILQQYNIDFNQKSTTMKRSKLGLFQNENSGNTLINSLEELLQMSKNDMTMFFRLLSNFEKKSPKKGFELIQHTFYNPALITPSITQKWHDWFNAYAEILQSETTTDAERKAKMDAVNPKYVLRNYIAQLAIEAADKGDFTVINELFQLLNRPYDEQPEYQKWFAKRPEWANDKIGCSMLSCSS